MGGTRLYIFSVPNWNRSRRVNDCDLEAIFSPHGTVQSAHVVMDPATNHSKGYGFVEMATGNQAQAAIDTLNGKDYNGHTLTVKEAKPPEDSNVVIVGAATSGIR